MAKQLSAAPVLTVTAADRRHQLSQTASYTALHTLLRRFACLCCSPVERIRIPDEEGRGPSGGANVCKMSLNLEIRQQRSCIQFKLHTEFGIFARSVGGYLL